MCERGRPGAAAFEFRTQVLTLFHSRVTKVRREILRKCSKKSKKSIRFLGISSFYGNARHTVARPESRVRPEVDCHQLDGATLPAQPLSLPQPYPYIARPPAFPNPLRPHPSPIDICYHLILTLPPRPHLSTHMLQRCCGVKWRRGGWW